MPSQGSLSCRLCLFSGPRKPRGKDGTAHCWTRTLKLLGAHFLATLCKNPSIAMSRRERKGAGLNENNNSDVTAYLKLPIYIRLETKIAF